MLSNILLNRLIHFIEMSDVDRRKGYYMRYGEERIWFDDEYFVRWLFDPGRASEKFSAKSELGHILISNFYLKQSEILFSDYCLDNISNKTKMTLLTKSKGCLPVDTLICMPKFCFHRLLHHIKESSDITLQNDFEKAIIRPLMSQNRTAETLSMLQER